jgi:hypothetical protein
MTDTQANTLSLASLFIHPPVCSPDQQGPGTDVNPLYRSWEAVSLKRG